MMTQIGRPVFTLGLAFLAALTLTLGLAAESDTGTAAAPAVSAPVLPATVPVAYAISSKTLAAKRASAYRFAKSQDPKRYCWGGGGTKKTAKCYDCSGLVLTSYLKQGLLKGVGRTDRAIRASSKTKHVSRYTAARGDLYFTPGHVGFVAGKPYKRGGKWYTPVYGASSSRTGIRGYTRSGVPHIERVVR